MSQKSFEERLKEAAEFNEPIVGGQPERYKYAMEASYKIGARWGYAEGKAESKARYDLLEQQYQDLRIESDSQDQLYASKQYREAAEVCALEAERDALKQENAELKSKNAFLQQNYAEAKDNQKIIAQQLSYAQKENEELKRMSIPLDTDPITKDDLTLLLKSQTKDLNRQLSEALKSREDFIRQLADAQKETHKTLAKLADAQEEIKSQKKHYEKIIDDFQSYDREWKKEVERLKKRLSAHEHNHITRDIKPLGECPSCDSYHKNQAVLGMREALDSGIDHLSDFANDGNDVQFNIDLKQMKDACANFDRLVKGEE